MYGSIGEKKKVEIVGLPKNAGGQKQRQNEPPLKKEKSAVFSRVFYNQSNSNDPSERTPHSFLYTMLNPRSNHTEAVLFKTFMTSTILIDLGFFIVSTEPMFANYKTFYYAEGVTSTIFLFEYLARLISVIESRNYKPLGPVRGRFKYMMSTNAIIDFLATFPFFIELATNVDLPTLTYLRVFRLLRILKTEAYSNAFDAVWRVLFYNREILYVALLVCIFLILCTSVLMYYLRPPNDENGDFESIASTMYVSTLMLTGQGGPDAENVPWYTKMIILLTGIFSVAMFAIPASMLTWGFEAEAERLAALTRRRAKYGLQRQDSSSSEWDSSDSEGTDEEYQKIIAGEDEEDEEKNALLKMFQAADVDQSGSLTAKEFIEQMEKTGMTMSTGPAGETRLVAGGLPPIERMQALENNVAALNEKMDTIIALLKERR